MHSHRRTESAIHMEACEESKLCRPVYYYTFDIRRSSMCRTVFVCVGTSWYSWHDFDIYVRHYPTKSKIWPLYVWYTVYIFRYCNVKCQNRFHSHLRDSSLSCSYNTIHINTLTTIRAILLYIDIYMCSVEPEENNTKISIDTGTKL